MSTSRTVLAVCLVVLVVVCSGTISQSYIRVNLANTSYDQCQFITLNIHHPGLQWYTVEQEASCDHSTLAESTVSYLGPHHHQLITLSAHHHPGCPPGLQWYTVQ